MDVKVLELRDRGTFIPVMAVRLSVSPSRLSGEQDAERYLLRRAGYSAEAIRPEWDGEPYVVLWPMTGGPANYDAFSWHNPRTYGIAHQYIIGHWGTLSPGDVIDVQFILGETSEKKKSELYTVGDVE